MKKLLVLLLLGFLSFAGGVKKEKKEKREKILREEIVVVAEKTRVPLLSLANSVELLTSRDLRRFQSQDLKEAMFLLPSTYTPSYNTHGIVASTFVRGVSSSRGLFSLEGIPLLDPNTYTLPLDTIPAFFLSSVETVMGPQSSLWGEGAMGFATFMSLDTEPTSSFRVMAGGMSTLSLEGKVGLRENNLSMKAGYSYFNTAGVTENNRYKRNSVYFSSSYSLSGINFKPFVIYTNQLGYIPFIMRGVPAKDRRARDKLFLASIPVVLKFKKIRLTLSPFYFQKSYTFTDPNDPWGFTNSSTMVKSKGIFAQGEIPLKEGFSLVSGLTWRRENLESKNNFMINYLNLTPSYLDSWINLIYHNKKLFLSAGGGYSSSSGYGGKFSPKIAGALWLGKRVKVRASYSKGLRFPSPSETTGPWGNPNLLPEQSEGYEGGLDFIPVNGLLLSITGFNTRFTDLITFDFPSWKFANVGKAEIKGLEFKASGSVENTLFSLSVLNLSARDLVKDQELLRRPKWLVKFLVSKNIATRATVSLFFVYVGERKDFDDQTWQTVENPAYYLLNLSAKYSLWKGMKIFLRADNLLNKKYEDIFGYPSPGRTVYSGLEFNF